MKLTRTGYRINKKGKVIDAIESDSFVSDEYIGKSTKQNGRYFYFNRKQGGLYIYLP